MLADGNWFPMTSAPYYHADCHGLVDPDDLPDLSLVLCISFCIDSVFALIMDVSLIRVIDVMCFKFCIVQTR